jgi:glycosyltransferase involved in cell wall biosynthesis
VPEALDVFRQRAVFAYPLSCDGGLKGKIVEAMAYAVPLVTTCAGIVGVEAVNGVHAWIGADDDAFAERVIALLQDPGLAQRIAQAARSLVEGQHTPGSVVARMEAFCQGMVQV